MHKGWFQIAFERDLKYGINCIELAKEPVIIIKSEDSLRAFSAICPHRGAHLADGKLENDEYIICPFHGCQIGLNRPGTEGFTAVEYALIAVSGLVFINLVNTLDNGFRNFIHAFDQTHYIIPGFELKVGIHPEMVIENAFDQMHFRTVHSIINEPKFTVTPSRYGEYSIESVFDIPPSIWLQGKVDARAFISVPYTAIAFSPYLVVSNLGGEHPYTVITSASYMKDSQSCIRLSIAVKAQQDTMPSIELCKYLIDQSRKGLELDKKIWENISPHSIQRFVKEEKAVIQFQTFCKTFV